MFVTWSRLDGSVVIIHARLYKLWWSSLGVVGLVASNHLPPPFLIYPCFVCVSVLVEAHPLNLGFLFPFGIGVPQ